MKKKLLLLSALAITSASSFGQSLPIYEPFNYSNPASGQALIGQTLTDVGTWVEGPSTSTSGPYDDIVDPLTQPTGDQAAFPTLEGNAYYFRGSGSDPVLKFSSVTSGTVYYSALISVAGWYGTTNSTPTVPDATGKTILSLLNTYTTTSDIKYPASLSAKYLSETQYYLGYNLDDTSDASEINYYSTALTFGTQYLIVLSYDIENQKGKLWINPVVSATEPTATLESVDSSSTLATEVAGFFIRLDSTTKTPMTTIDELRIASTWAEVLGQSPLSVAQNQISGLSVYPNPVKEGVVYISTSKSDDLSVEVYDILGKKLISSEVTSGTLDVSSLLKGVYVMKITEGSATSTKKLVIE